MKSYIDKNVSEERTASIFKVCLSRLGDGIPSRSFLQIEVKVDTLTTGMVYKAKGSVLNGLPARTLLLQN